MGIGCGSLTSKLRTDAFLIIFVCLKYLCNMTGGIIERGHIKMEGSSDRFLPEKHMRGQNI